MRAVMMLRNSSSRLFLITIMSAAAFAAAQRPLVDQYPLRGESHDTQYGLFAK